MVRRSKRRVLALALSCLFFAAVVGPPVAPAVGAAAANDTATDRTAAPTVNATGAWEQGYTGENVTVAVIDDHFDADHPVIDDNVADTWALEGTEPDFDDPTGHGTNVSAMVVQTAPDVDLKLYDPGDTGEPLATAIRRAGSEADVVVTAYGDHFGRPIDGTSVTARALNDVADNGTTVVVAAGNEGDNPFYHDTWTDTDGDGWHEFPDGDERMRVRNALSLDIQWTDWDGVDSDYDLHLVGPDGAPIQNVTGEDGLPDTPDVGDLLDLPVPDETYLKISATGPDPDDRLTVWSWPGRSTYEFGGEARSLVTYASAEEAITVGAYDVRTDELAPYSSRGPTVDGRQKPEVLGATNLSAPAGGYFGGTSAAAPTVAGTAALMEEAHGDITPDQTEALLTRTARPVTGTEPNNRTGHGLVDATAAVEAVTGPTVEPIDGVRPTDPDGDGELEDLDGDGVVTTRDAETLFEHMRDSVITDHADAYDFTGDGEVGHADVVALHDAAVVAPIDGTLPTDPDGDGEFEDLNGDGAVTSADVDVLFEHMRDDVVTDYAAVYDFNGNGEIGHADVVALYEAAD